MEEKEIIAKLNNENIDLKNHIKKLNKDIAQLHAKNNAMTEETIKMVKTQKKRLKEFEAKHGSVINNILEIVKNDNFTNFPAQQRVFAIEREYKQHILG